MCVCFFSLVIMQEDQRKSLFSWYPKVSFFLYHVGTGNQHFKTNVKICSMFYAKLLLKNRQKTQKMKSLSCLLSEILLTKDDIT